MSRDDAPSVDSVIDEVNTVTGYPELYYFKKAYFIPTINEQNQALFTNIHLYENSSDPYANYE